MQRAEILQRFQNRYLRIIVNTPWYITNDTLHHDLNVPHVREEIKRLSQKYADRMEEYPLMKEVKTITPIKKKTTSTLVYLIAYAFQASINCQMNY